MNLVEPIQSQTSGPRGPVRVTVPRTLQQVQANQSHGQVNQPRGPVQINQPRGPVQVNQPRGPVQVNQPRGPVQVNQPRGPVVDHLQGQNTPSFSTTQSEVGQGTELREPFESTHEVNQSNQVSSQVNLQNQNTNGTVSLPRRRRVFPVGQEIRLSTVEQTRPIQQDQSSTTVVEQTTQILPVQQNHRVRRCFPVGQQIPVSQQSQRQPIMNQQVSTRPPTMNQQVNSRPPIMNQQVPVGTVIDGLNGVGRAVQNRSFDVVIRQFVDLISQAEIASNYREIWDQSGGPQLNALAMQANMEDCGINGYRNRNACFVYMFMATHIPIPGAPGSVEFNEALAQIGLTEFLSSEVRAESLREMLLGSAVSQLNGNLNNDRTGIMRESFGHNWIVRCQSVMNSSSVRQAVFRHRLYRYTATNNLANGGIEFDFQQTMITRDHAFLDSAREFENIQANQFRRGLMSMRFAHESAYGDGVRNEWFTTVARQIFNPSVNSILSDHELNPRLFQKRETWSVLSENIAINEPNRRLFEFIGRFMALSIVQGVQFDALLPQSYLARLMGQNVTIDLLAELHEYAYVTYGGMDQYDDETFRVLFDVDENVVLDENNRNEIIQEKLNQDGVNNQVELFNSMARRFNEIIPAEVFEGLTARDLQSLVYGESEIVIENNDQFIRDNFTISHLSDEIRILFEILESFDQTQRRGFLRFVTASSQLPRGGFPALRSRIQINVEDVADPAAQTCFNKLIIPRMQGTNILQRNEQIRRAYRDLLRERLLGGILALDLAGMSETAVRAHLGNVRFGQPTSGESNN